MFYTIDEEKAEDIPIKTPIIKKYKLQ